MDHLRCVPLTAPGELPRCGDRTSDERAEVMIQEERVKWINRNKIRAGEYVLYWMQASQRAEYNHALDYSIIQANEGDKPLVVFFGVTNKFPEANLRHYSFMLEGLGEVQKSLQGKGIKMVVRHKSPERGVLELAKGACLVVTDR
jgi:deoxyribodipyrimidine photo-lyase